MTQEEVSLSQVSMPFSDPPMKATEQLWATIQHQKDIEAAEAEAASALVVGPDATMADASPSVFPAHVDSQAPTPSPAAAAVATAEQSSGRDRDRDQRIIAEKAVLSLLSLLDQMSNANAICSSPLVGYSLSIFSRDVS